MAGLNVKLWAQINSFRHSRTMYGQVRSLTSHVSLPLQLCPALPFGNSLSETWRGSKFFVTSLPLKKARSSIGAPPVLRAMRPMLYPPWMPPPASHQPSKDPPTGICHPPWPPWRVPPTPLMCQPPLATVYGEAGSSEVLWPLGPNL